MPSTRTSWRRSAPLAGALIGALACLAGEGGAQASWLDEDPPPSWNTSGAAVPDAPPRENGQPRCREGARPPQSAEDREVVGRGWDLVGDPEEGDGVVVITGTANYDGMCRPWQYQAFVFVNGTLAGTLSPEPMDARTDGALTSVSIGDGRRLTAGYARYTETDPLCCPSGRTTVDFDIEDTDAGPVVRPLSAETHRSEDGHTM